MTEKRRVWLVVNKASGSNDEEAIEQLQDSCRGVGFALDRTIAFPDQPLPTAKALDTAAIDVVVVFAGDGTVNSLVGKLSGWSGAVLILPGGTMNLMYHRLHGDRPAEEVIALAAAGRASRARPGIIATDAGMALADCLAGPGTCWYEVREALRDANVVEAAGKTAGAIGETLGGPGIACRKPALGKPDGYPLLMLTPTDSGISISGYYAENPAEFLQGSLAVLRHRFREGPHDDLGVVSEVTLASTDGETFGILLDGEKSQSRAEAVFSLVPCSVDLLATRTDGW
jgi:hypothetical protein